MTTNEASNQDRWQTAYDQELPDDATRYTVLGSPSKPMYSPQDWDGSDHDTRLGVPGEFPYTRGVYTTMHRGRTWTQRQLIGLGTPGDYNKRVLTLLDAGATAISLIPCNSVFRGWIVMKSIRCCLARAAQSSTRPITWTRRWTEFPSVRSQRR